MKKILFSVFAFALVLFTFSPNKISAKILTNQKGSVNVAATEIIDDDLFIGAQSVTIDGTVNGDVFIGGQTAMINGVINGNLHVGAGTVILTGKVMGNVYIGSGNVTITKSTIEGSLLVGAGNVNIDNGTMISGSLIAGAGTITIDSWIRRSVYLGSGNATLGNFTRIGKDLHYSTDKDGSGIKMAQGMMVSGNIYKNVYQIPSAQKKDTTKNVKPIMGLVSFLGTFIIGILYFKFCNIQLTESADIVSKKFWKSFGIGLLIMIGIIPAMIIMLITVIGIPLAGVAFMIFLLGIYFAKIVVALVLGNWITKKFNWKQLSFYSVFAMGLAAIYILKLIPILGWFASMVIVWTGLGALVMQAFLKIKTK